MKNPRSVTWLLCTLDLVIASVRIKVARGIPPA
jgi:hypothetical protein